MMWAVLCLVVIGAVMARLRFRGKAKPRKATVQIVLDEVAAIGGKMDAIENMIGLGRSYGLRGLLVVQDLAQLKRSSRMISTKP